jgi:hypothetical protein
LEVMGEVRRIDRTVEPTAYHCAILSDGELEQLRKINDVVRLGHVTAIDTSEIRLEQGTIPTSPTTLHVDCSASGIPKRPTTTVFVHDRITLQLVRTCQPTFSAAFIGFVEATFTDENEKNRICTPIPAPNVPRDWLAMLRIDLKNRDCWAQHAQLGEWMVETRLDPVAKTIRALLGKDVEATQHLGRYVHHLQQAEANLDALLAE